MGPPPVARGEEEAQGDAPAEVRGQPPVRRDEEIEALEEAFYNLPDLRMEEGNRGNDEEEVVVIPDEEELHGVLLYPLTSKVPPRVVGLMR